MGEFEKVLSAGSFNIKVAIKDEDLIKTTAYLSVGIFVAVLLAVVIANKIKF